MFCPERFQCLLHAVDVLKILRFCYAAFCNLPAGFDRIQLWRVWWNVLNADVRVLLDEVFYARSFVVADVIKQQQILLFLAKFAE